MPYLFTSESVSEGHPDKVADQISDALLDEYLRHDPKSRVACETLVTTGLVVCSGEVKSAHHVDVDRIVRNTIRAIGYNKAEYRFEADSCGVITTIHEQSADINMGVDRQREEEQGAGDQGMMFGYATNEDDTTYLPLPIGLSHLLLRELAGIRKEGKVMTYLRPDAKAQVTIEYSDDHKPLRIETLVLSTQHDEGVGQKEIADDVRNILIPRVKSKTSKFAHLFDKEFRMHINPTGKFVIGGPHGDTGLTGRKIIVDTYGGRGAHGGGAFSGKDSSKVDRSAAYATRYIAKNLVAAGVADEVLVQVAYAIGVAEPVGFYVNTYGTARVRNGSGQIMSDSDIAARVVRLFDLRPFHIVKQLGLQDPIFFPTATYGHFGRDCEEKKVQVFHNGEGTELIDGTHYKKVKFFSWEALDLVPAIIAEFGL